MTTAGSSRPWALAVIVVMAAVAGAGCSSAGRRETSSAKEEVAIPQDSPFAKIKKGMGMSEVYSILGTPTDTKTYATGKAWIPFHFGGDNARSEALYKGMGTIIFSLTGTFGGDLRVVKIVYDPNERGYR